MGDKLNKEELSKIIGQAQRKLESINYKNKKSGALYTVTKIVLREVDCIPMVEYFEPDNWAIPWVRPLDEFLEKFEKVG